MKLVYLFLSSSVLIGAVLLIRKCFRRMLAPGVLFALWLIPLLRLMLPAGIGLSVSSEKMTQTLNAPYALVREAVEQTEALRMQSLEELPKKEKVKIYDAVPLKKQEISKAYVLWFLGSIGVLGVAICKNHRLQRSFGKLEITAMQEKIPICVGEKVTNSCLVGLIKPRVLLPLKVWEDPESSKYAVAHEMAHYKRKDHFWSAVRILCCAVYWWHPLVWAAAMAVKEDAELACDAKVLKQADEAERRNYGYALLKLLTLEQSREDRLWMAVSFSGGKKTMTKRIEEITNKTKTRKRVLLPVFTLLLLLLAAGCIFLKEDEQWISCISTEQSWDDENISYLEMEYHYETGDAIKSKLFYYEVYEYGELTDRHVAAYGAVENDKEQTIELCLKNDSEAQTLLLTENGGAQSSIPVINEAYKSGARGGSTGYAETPIKLQPGKELLLYEERQGESTGVDDLEALTEEQIQVQTKEIERTLLIRLVFSELSEEELYENYKKIEVAR